MSLPVVQLYLGMVTDMVSTDRATSATLNTAYMLPSVMINVEVNIHTLCVNEV